MKCILKSTGWFFYGPTLILHEIFKFISRYRGLVFCIVLCKVCSFVPYLSFGFEMAGLIVLYSWTKVLKLKNSQKLHLKNTHFYPHLINERIKGRICRINRCLSVNILHSFRTISSEYSRLVYLILPYALLTSLGKQVICYHLFLLVMFKS